MAVQRGDGLRNSPERRPGGPPQGISVVSGSSSDDPGPPVTSPVDGVETALRAGWKVALVLAVKLVLAAVALVLAVRVVKRIDWRQVLDAVGQLHWSQIAILAVVVLLRQSLSASPLVFLVPRLGPGRAILNGMCGTLITTFMPPPSEIILRLSMFKSWQVDAFRGAAALALNTLVFYMARFAAPMLGLVFAVSLLSAPPVYWWSAAGGLMVVLLLAGGLNLVSRGESLANRIGHGAGKIVGRVRKDVDPAQWSAALVRFQRESTTGLARRMLPSGVGLLLFMVVDGSIIVACLRFLGVSSSQLSYPAVLATFLCVYPLTIFPFAGIGVLEASAVVLLNQVYVVDQAHLVAALVVWRAATLVFPLVPGLCALAWWRLSLRGQASETKTQPESHA